MLNLGRLRLLSELHRRGTVAAVAAALAYSPSTVSRQLGELQREAGVDLFERDGRQLRLTGAALVLVRHAEILLNQVERAEAEMAAAAAAVTGIVRVAAFQTASIRLVAPALSALATRHPGLRVEVEEAAPEQAVESLARREVDLVLYDEYEHVDQPRPRDMTFEELLIEPVWLVVPAGHPAASPRPMRLAGLADQPWAAGPRHNSHGRLVAHVCTAYGGFSPDVRHRVTDLLVLHALVTSGQALTLLPDLAVSPHDSAIRLCHVADTTMRRHIFTVTRPDSSSRPSLTAVRDALHDAAHLVG